MASLLNLRNKHVFEELFKTHYAQLVRFAYNYLSDQDASEELVQDVFFKLWELNKPLEINSSVESYLFGAVRNAALNVIKHEKVVQKHRQYQLAHGTFSSIDNPLEFDQLRARVDLAMAKIPEKCREIFEMSRFQGKRYKEIAEELGLSVKTVENQMGKALKILRFELKDLMPCICLLIIYNGGKL